jgi:NADH:ubiquinone oxidoreductase subunit 3 (subunit A)
MTALLLSPPVAVAFFFLVAYGLYRLGGYVAAREAPHEDKLRAYTGGEEVPPPESLLTYHAFFRLALLFGILHVAALVVSTLPARGASHRVALTYLIGIGVSVVMLAAEGREEG